MCHCTSTSLAGLTTTLFLILLMFKIFIDSANIDEIKECVETGLIDGVTTNPTLIRKSGLGVIPAYKLIADMDIKDISMEVSGNYREMFDEAMVLTDMFKDVATIKLPMTVEGLKVCQDLSDLRIRTNVTLVFNAAQAMLAAKAGAAYVSPFVGRIDDQGYAGTEVVRSIANMYCSAGVGTKVLAASIRTPQRVVRCVYSGAEIVTMPPSVFWQMYDHVLTDAGLAVFEEDLKLIE